MSKGKGLGTAGGILAGGPVGGVVGGALGGAGDAANSMREAADRQTQANRPNQNTPFANSQWSRDQYGNWSQNTSLNPELQGGLFNLESQYNKANANPLDNGADARQHAEDNLYQRETSRLDPQWSQQQDAFKNELLNQGFTPGTQAYDNAYGNFARAKNDAYSTARNDAITMGGNEATRQQQMDLLQRMAPLMGMQGLQGMMGMPAFAPGGNYEDAQKAANQYQSDIYGGLFNLGGNVGKAFAGGH